MKIRNIFMFRMGNVLEKQTKRSAEQQNKANAKQTVSQSKTTNQAERFAVRVLQRNSKTEREPFHKQYCKIGEASLYHVQMKIENIYHLKFVIFYNGACKRKVVQRFIT